VPGQIWVIKDLKADITLDGRAHVKGTGLVLGGGNNVGRIPAGATVFATLTCGAGPVFTFHSTSPTGVPLQPNGDFQIDDTLTGDPLPTTALMRFFSSAARRRPNPGLPLASRNRKTDQSEAAASRVERSRGNATDLLLPDIGIFGNSHQMMSETNSDEIAQVLVDWINANVKERRSGVSTEVESG
jgi:hypothetical protein